MAFKTAVAGGVLSCSGAARNFMAKPREGARRAAFLFGMVAAGIVMSKLYGNFEPAPGSRAPSRQRVEVYVRLVVGGLLVGAGTALGNGCTSGHGLTGLARLSLRSWVAVPCFMFFAVLTATLTGSSAALPPDPASEREAPVWHAAWAVSACIGAPLLLAAILALKVQAQIGPEMAQRARLAAEFVCGCAFSCGLAISGMARPSKVVAFLDLGSGAWDPSLAFVMGAALCITFPFLQVLERMSSSSPLLGGPFDLPPKSPVDRNLCAGAVLFGMGWGTCGMCPGPIWVVLGAVPSVEVLVAAASMLAGTAMWVIWHKTRPAGTVQVKAPSCDGDEEMGDQSDVEVASIGDSANSTPAGAGANLP